MLYVFPLSLMHEYKSVTFSYRSPLNPVFHALQFRHFTSLRALSSLSLHTSHKEKRSNNYIAMSWGKSWLGEYLTQRGVLPELVQLCEEKLVVQEGFCSPLFLMSVNFQCQFFNHAYLHLLGITALGICEELLCLHEDLALALNEQLGGRCSSGPAAATRAALKIVLPMARTEYVLVESVSCRK